MDKERKKELQEQYQNRHPDMGVVTWRHGDDIWVAATADADADFNRMSFQLKLGSWPNRDLQVAYKTDPDGFVWALEKKLDYEDPTEDYSDDLEILLMDFLDEHLSAKPMKPWKKRK